MSAGFRAAFRRLKHAGDDAGRYMDEKLPDVAHFLSDHFGAFLRKIRGNDHFDAPSGSGTTPSSGSSDLVPRPETLGADGKIDWDQAPEDGFVLDGDDNPIFEDHYPQPGDRFDRYGEPRGSFVSPIGEDGPFDYDSRSMPYSENPNAYHEYEWTRELGDARAQYDQLNPEDRAVVDSGMSYFEQDIDNLSPVARGEAAAIPAWGMPGGATQDKLPVSVEMLGILDMIREVR